MAKGFQIEKGIGKDGHKYMAGHNINICNNIDNEVTKEEEIFVNIKMKPNMAELRQKTAFFTREAEHYEHLSEEAYDSLRKKEIQLEKLNQSKLLKRIFRFLGSSAGIWITIYNYVHNVSDTSTVTVTAVAILAACMSIAAGKFAAVCGEALHEYFSKSRERRFEKKKETYNMYQNKAAENAAEAEKIRSIYRNLNFKEILG